jgi:methionyl aminopeptidase
MFWERAKIAYKSEEEIALIKLSADVLGRVHGMISKEIIEGVSTLHLDKLTYDFIKDHKGTPSFLKYRDFPNTLCISVNETVVHGLPSDYQLRDGDIVSVDCGVFMNGFHADSAYTYKVGNVSEKAKRLLKSTYDSLYKGIEASRQGLRIGDIGHAIQNHVENLGYSVVRELVGHGVGSALHEEPEVPNFGKRGKGHKLIKGMVIAIEPMINMGKKDVYQENDGWTVNTVDGQLSAHFEHTVLITDKQPEVLTTFKYISEEQKI